jgi:hypothetical protein
MSVVRVTVVDMSRSSSKTNAWSDTDLTNAVLAEVIAGRVGLLLRTYSDYIVGNAAGLMVPRPNAA